MAETRARSGPTLTQRVASLEQAVAEIGHRLDDVATAEAVIRRAAFAPVPTGRGRARHRRTADPAQLRLMGLIVPLMALILLIAGHLPGRDYP
jgi:hypothetical protein